MFFKPCVLHNTAQGRWKVFVWRLTTDGRVWDHGGKIPQHQSWNHGTVRRTDDKWLVLKQAEQTPLTEQMIQTMETDAYAERFQQTRTGERGGNVENLVITKPATRQYVLHLSCIVPCTVRESRDSMCREESHGVATVWCNTGCTTATTKDKSSKNVHGNFAHSPWKWNGVVI